MTGFSFWGELTLALKKGALLSDSLGWEGLCRT